MHWKDRERGGFLSFFFFVSFRFLYFCFFLSFSDCLEGKTVMPSVGLIGNAMMESETTGEPFESVLLGVGLSMS